MNWNTFAVFLTSTAASLILVRGVQALAHFGWSGRQARRWWRATLSSVPLVLVLGYIYAVRLPPERMWVTIASGVLVASLLLLLTGKPRWPENS